MSEERLQEIKDSVDFQKEMLLAHNLGTLCVDEEQELIDEIERLQNIIKEVREYITKQVHRNQQFYEMDIENILEILDKENNYE